MNRAARNENYSKNLLAGLGSLHERGKSHVTLDELAAAAAEQDQAYTLKRRWTMLALTGHWPQHSPTAKDYPPTRKGAQPLVNELIERGLVGSVDNALARFDLGMPPTEPGKFYYLVLPEEQTPTQLQPDLM